VRTEESSSFRFPSRRLSNDAIGVKGFENLAVLVTGASGFIGSHTVRALVAAKARVHCFVRAGSDMSRVADCAHWIEVHEGNIEDFDAVQRAVQASRPQVVFHLAGDFSARRSEGGWDAIDRSVQINLGGTLNIIRACSDAASDVKTLLRAGGLEEYGTARIPFVETDREQPVSAYSASQVATTHFCEALQPVCAPDLVTLRPALVFGPAQASRFFIPQLIESCLDGKDFEMTDGTQRRDFIYIDDVVAGLMAVALKSGLRGEVINLATGEEHAVSDVAEMIVRLTGARIHLNRGARTTSSSDLAHLAGSTEHAASCLGWRASVSLEDGLTRTVAWHRAQRAPANS
jgi:nucleoside-diphosphate-sugar epimerase